VRLNEIQIERAMGNAQYAFRAMVDEMAVELAGSPTAAFINRACDIADRSVTIAFQFEVSLLKGVVDECSQVSD
jgi:hypothetical protein